MNEARRKAAKAARLRHPQGINTSLAAISIAYIATFGEHHPANMPYNKAGEAVREARPIDWVLVLEEAQALVSAAPKGGLDIEACARQLAQQMNG